MLSVKQALLSVIFVYSKRHYDLWLRAMQQLTACYHIPQKEN